MLGERPKWFQFASITSMVLGALGVMAGIWAPVNLFIAKNNPMMNMGGAPPPELAEFQEKLMAASMPEATAFVGVLNLATGAWALWAGYKLLQLHPGAREKFRTAVLALGAYEVIALLFNVILQVRMFSIMDSLMADLMKNSGGTPPPPEITKTMEAAMGVGMIIAIMTTVIWGGCKIFFAFWARGYTARREVVAYAGE